MNIFEGARRVLCVFAGLIFIGFTVSIFANTPYVEFRHYTILPGYKLQQVLGCSGGNEQRAHVENERAYVIALLCTDVPFDKITLPISEAAALEDAITSEQWRYARQQFGFATVTIIISWLLAYAIGWIVRGFLGIPRGQDYRIAQIKK